MGAYVAYSALRDVSVDETVDALSTYVYSYKLQLEAVAEPDEAISLFALTGWTLIKWPDLAAYDFQACLELSGLMATVGSSVHIRDDDYWAHLLCRVGSVVDVFTSASPSDAEERYPGHGSAVASTLSVGDASAIEAYFAPTAGGVPVRAHPRDEFTLNDPWVFTDFWRTLGIELPESEDRPHAALRPRQGSFDQLPRGNFSI